LDPSEDEDVSSDPKEDENVGSFDEAPLADEDVCAVGRAPSLPLVVLPAAGRGVEPGGGMSSVEGASMRPQEVFSLRGWRGRVRPCQLETG